MTVALYARVSTRDGRQSVENQIREMTRFAVARGWTVGSSDGVHRFHYIDEETGSKGEGNRDGLAELMRDVHARRFDAVLVFALDRLTREGIFKAFSYIRRMKDAGVHFISVKEEHFSTTGPAGEPFLAFAAWMAQQERIRLQERIKAGLDRAKANGTQLGRRHGRIFDREKARRLLDSGKSWRQVGKALGVPHTTLRRRMQAA